MDSGRHGVERGDKSRWGERQNKSLDRARTKEGETIVGTGGLKKWELGRWGPELPPPLSEGGSATPLKKREAFGIRRKVHHR